MERYAQVLKYFDFTGNFELSDFHEKGCLRKEVCFGIKNAEMVPNYRFWTDKAEDAA
jgi:hypothetical protein